MKQKLDIKQLKKLKKGDKIKIGKEEYRVEEFDAHFNKKSNNDFEEGKEIILTKIGENPKVLLKQKYALRYNDKTKEVKLLKEVHEKKKFPEGFQERRKVYWAHYEERR